MNIFSRRPGRQQALPAPPAAPAPAGLDEDAPPLGCGWFDSSHELHSGLWVREHASPNEWVAELPLAWWLELHLAGAWPRPPA